MNKFIELLTESENSIKAREYSRRHGMGYQIRHFNALEAGQYKISIQASKFHYCEPRETLGDLADYSEMEIAIFKNNKWVQPRDDEYIQQFERFPELIEHYEDGDTAVGGWLPVDLIQDLYEYLCLSGETK
jgi:hypothetical protein